MVHKLGQTYQYTNEQQATGSKVNLLYLTPMCYTKAFDDANVTWATKSDNVFPYSSHYHSYWIGYFTFRPAQKDYIHEMNNLFQAGKKLIALTKSPSTIGVAFSKKPWRRINIMTLLLELTNKTCKTTTRSDCLKAWRSHRQMLLTFLTFRLLTSARKETLAFEKMRS